LIPDWLEIRRESSSRFVRDTWLSHGEIKEVGDVSGVWLGRVEAKGKVRKMGKRRC
jgi:hypothetical protein